jgi:hypothetical protein
VISSLLERKIEKRPSQVRLQGRILFLTEDPELIRKQLAGWDLPWDTKNPAGNPKLRDDISTDEITPAHYCFYFDWAQRRKERWLRLLGKRQASRQRIEPRAVTLCRDVRRDSSRDRREY